MKYLPALFLSVVFISANTSSAFAMVNACSSANESFSDITYYIALIYIISCFMVAKHKASIIKFLSNLKNLRFSRGKKVIAEGF